ncbi:MAG TPA: FHA domain-containing protein [Myxococcota bacterium]|nr:FHA domain-containing protein [Myxococcota bacterium]
MSHGLCLVVTDRIGRVREIALPGGEVLLGRKSDNQVVLSDDSVAPHHAKLLVEGGRVTLMDLASTSGTFVNGRRILRRELAPSDRVTIGAFELRIGTPAAARAHSEALPGPAPRAAPKGGAAPDDFADAASETTTPMDFTTLRSVRTPEPTPRLGSRRRRGGDPMRKTMPGRAAGAAPPSEGDPASADTADPDDGPGARVEARTLGRDGAPLRALAADDLVMLDDDLGTDRRPPLAVRPMTVPSAPARAPAPARASATPVGTAPLRAAATTPAGPAPARGSAGAGTAPAALAGQPHAVPPPASTRGGRLWLEQIELLDVPGTTHVARTPPVGDVAYLRLLCRLAEALRASASASASAEQTCTRAFDLLWETMPADVGVLFLANDAGAPVPLAMRTKEKIPPGEIPVSRTVVDRVLRDKVAVHCDDIRDDTRFHAGSSLFLYNVRSVMAVPLLAGPAALGVVYLHRGPGNSFEGRDLDVLVAVAHMVALALERSRLGAGQSRRDQLRAVVGAHLPASAADALVERLARTPAPAFVVEPMTAVVLCAAERGPERLGRALQDDELASYCGEQSHLLREAVRAEGGVVAGDGPDGLVALFPVDDLPGAGAPRGAAPAAAAAARTAAARAALRAALAMRAACAARLRRHAGSGLAVALALGTVDAGFVSAGERVVYLAQGGAMAAARALQGRAAPGDLWLTADVQALLGDAVPVEPAAADGPDGRRAFSVPAGVSVTAPR